MVILIGIGGDVLVVDPADLIYLVVNQADPLDITCMAVDLGDITCTAVDPVDPGDVTCRTVDLGDLGDVTCMAVGLVDVPIPMGEWIGVMLAVLIVVIAGNVEKDKYQESIGIFGICLF
jgi:hypothetical protein